MDFVSAGRISEVDGGETTGGRYTYQNTGVNGGTLKIYFDDDDSCTVRLTFDSTTGGSAYLACRSGLTVGWQIEDIPA